MNPYTMIAIIANGAIQDYSITASIIGDYHTIVAVDGGLQHCALMHLSPSLLVGDLDSVDPDLLKKYPDLPIRRFPREKDETDLELALQALYHPEVEKITVFGALEKRTDHTLSNLNLICRYPGKVFLENEREVIFSISGSIAIPCYEGQVISFMPLGSFTASISSQGLKWELKEATFDKYYYSLSNVCLSNLVKIHIGQGDLLCCLQK